MQMKLFATLTAAVTQAWQQGQFYGITLHAAGRSEMQFVALLGFREISEMCKAVSVSSLGLSADGDTKWLRMSQRTVTS